MLWNLECPVGLSVIWTVRHKIKNALTSRIHSVVFIVTYPRNEI